MSLALEVFQDGPTLLTQAQASLTQEATAEEPSKPLIHKDRDTCAAGELEPESLCLAGTCLPEMSTSPRSEPPGSVHGMFSRAELLHLPGCAKGSTPRMLDV